MRTPRLAMILVLLVGMTNAVATAGPKHCPPGHAKEGLVQSWIVTHSTTWNQDEGV